MEIVNSKKIRTIVFFISAFAILITSIPLYLYLKIFNGGLSNIQSEWGTFGDFIGGVIGTIFSLIAVIFSLVSIYITLKIATRIHENEQSFNEERLSKEIEIIHKQNKPYLYVNLSKSKKLSKVEILNSGNGPLVISKWSIAYKQEVFNNFAELLYFKIDVVKYRESVSISINTAPAHIIAPNVSKVFIRIKPKKKNKAEFLEFHSKCQEIFEYSTINFEYEDIFENKFKHSQSLSFLRK